MDSESNQKFSHYLVLKRINPSQYYTKSNHEEMNSAYKHQGKAFFDVYNGELNP